MKLASILAAGALAAAVAIAPAAPAAASSSNLYHDPSDGGYNAPFYISCGGTIAANGQNYYIYPGGSSSTYCGSHDTWVYVNPGTQIVCLGGNGLWRTEWDQDNYWHKVGQKLGSSYWRCVYQQD